MLRHSYSACGAADDGCGDAECQGADGAAASAGFSASITAADQGAQVALIGSGTIGGTCVNIGCVPSKTLIRAAETLHNARVAARFAEYYFDVGGAGVGVAGSGNSGGGGAVVFGPRRAGTLRVLGAHAAGLPAILGHNSAPRAVAGRGDRVDRAGIQLVGTR